MVETSTICNFGWKAPEFALKGVDGKIHGFADVRGKNGTLIVFLSNTCPYVQAVIGRIVEEARALQQLGIGVAGINANAGSDPRDAFDKMQNYARERGFTFPYLIDESQDMARAYDAQCTPDFFGFNADGELQYRGRLDASRRELLPDVRRDLYEAMKQIAETGKGPAEQIPSMGCGIKWKEAEGVA